jgi:DNA processing protein
MKEARMLLGTHAELAQPRSSRSRYTPPSEIQIAKLSDLLDYCGRPIGAGQNDLFRKDGEAEPEIYLAGDASLLLRPGVSVIGARDVSLDGVRRAGRIAREMAKAGIVVTSGLAKGVDTAAHNGALDVGGSTIAVIGTPLDKSYPIENADIQQEIWQHHLLVSQFKPGQRTFPSDFPKRNRLMAQLTDASIIVEASDTSGTLHQAAECTRLGRWLFIMKSVAENPKLSWPAKFLGLPKVAVLETPEDVIERVNR